MSSDIPSAEELERLYAMSSDGSPQKTAQQEPRPTARRVVQRRVAEKAVAGQRAAAERDRLRQEAELERARHQTAMLAEERRQRKIASLADSLTLPAPAPPPQPEPIVVTKTRGPGFVAGFVLGVIAGVVLTWWRSR